MVNIYFLTEKILCSTVRLRQREAEKEGGNEGGKNTDGSRLQGKWEDSEREREKGKNRKARVRERDREGERG